MPDLDKGVVSRASDESKAALFGPHVDGTCDITATIGAEADLGRTARRRVAADHIDAITAEDRLTLATADREGTGLRGTPDRKNAAIVTETITVVKVDGSGNNLGITGTVVVIDRREILHAIPSRYEGNKTRAGILEAALEIQVASRHDDEAETVIHELGGGHEGIVQGEISGIRDDDVPGAEVARDDRALVFTGVVVIRAIGRGGGAVHHVLVTVATEVVGAVEAPNVVGAVNEVDIAVRSCSRIENGIAVHESLDTALASATGGAAAEGPVGSVAVAVADHGVGAGCRTAGHDEVSALVSDGIDAPGKIARSIGPAMSDLDILVGAAAAIHRDASGINITAHYRDGTAVVAGSIVTTMADLAVGASSGSVEAVVESDGSVGSHADITEVGARRTAATLPDLSVGVDARTGIHENVSGDADLDLTVHEARAMISGRPDSTVTDLGEGIESCTGKHREIARCGPHVDGTVS